MKRNDCEDFPDTVLIGSGALYLLAKGAIQMLNIIINFDVTVNCDVKQVVYLTSQY